MSAKKKLILGANGQVGRALSALLPDAVSVDRSTFDVTDAESYDSVDWRSYDTIINCAAFTAVDEAETPSGLRASWEINVSATAHMARTAIQHRLTLVHISSDYVFDGSEEIHTEDEGLSPLSVYGQTKAAGDAIVSAVPRHFIVRTSWVIGDGNNFVRTMSSLAKRGVSPRVVNDQFGRLSFATDIAAGISHLISGEVPYGTYNLSNDGPVVSWADVARDVFDLLGAESKLISGVSTDEYFAGKEAAPRPTHSALDLTKIKSVGFVPRLARDALEDYLKILAE